ncbi:hypothetical protein [Aquimarina sp. I32.4]|nr:hypothetical protein [Aquimarina sp. I32.4]
MKRLFLATIVLLVTSFIYVGCTPESLDQNDIKQLDKEELEENDI